MVRRLVMAVVLVSLVAAPGAWAQDSFGVDTPAVPDRVGTPDSTGGGPLLTEVYGTINPSVAMIAPIAFRPYKNGLGYIFWTSGYVSPMTGSPWLFYDAEIHLPTGALLNAFWIAVYDNLSTAGIAVWLMEETCPMSQACTSAELVYAETSDADTPGYVIVSDSSAAGHVWRNFDSQGINKSVYHFLRARFDEVSSDVRLGPVWLWYFRQVSPAPASATFADVPTGHWAFRFIEALVSSGITAGCGGGNYCPDGNVTRAEMAVYLAAALGLDYPDL